MFPLLSDFNPMYAFNNHFAPKVMESYLTDPDKLTEQEKNAYSMDYLEEAFQEIATKNPEYFSERLTRQEETISGINSSIEEKVRGDSRITPR